MNLLLQRLLRSTRKYEFDDCYLLKVKIILINHSNILIMDPTLEEENLCNGSFTITLNKEDDICSLFKPGKNKAKYLKTIFFSII